MAAETSPRPGSVARAWRHGALVGAAASVGAASVTFAVSSGVAALVARHVVTPSRRPGNVTVLKLEKDPNSGQDLVTLPATPDTRVAGTYALRFDNGGGVARIGFIVRQTGATVTRLVESVHGSELTEGARGWWTGTVYAVPSDAGLPFEEVLIPTVLGSAPAWFVPAEETPADVTEAHGDATTGAGPRAASTGTPDDAAAGGVPAEAGSAPDPGSEDGPRATGTWAVMVHGRGAQRTECIRGARVARRLGLNSLLLSYRNDGEAPATADGRYGLGFTEWEDVQAGIRWALEHGAEQIVLFGWSMGGAIVLRTAELTQYRDRVRALVLTGPVVDWYELLAHQTKVHQVPRRIGRLAADMISHKLGPRITGLAAPLDLHALDWLSRWEDVDTPTLILHSTDDEVVPVAGSVKLADLSPLVDFVGFTGARHTKEWNIDRTRYERAIEDWLPRHLGPHS